jgi:hypothetical protein
MSRFEPGGARLHDEPGSLISERRGVTKTRTRIARYTVFPSRFDLHHFAVMFSFSAVDGFKACTEPQSIEHARRGGIPERHIRP